MESDNIVECGTWKGLGSTLCLHLGMIWPEQRLWTIEQDAKAWAEAKANYDDPRITFIHGHVLDVLDQLPDKIDLLVMDGSGADEALKEWAALSNRCAHVAMDDICEDKNLSVFELTLSIGWTVIKAITTERNGWAIVKHP